jgi:hypothetical protein
VSYEKASLNSTADIFLPCFSLHGLAPVGRLRKRIGGA